jgi:hypothetical protein
LEDELTLKWVTFKVSVNLPEGIWRFPEMGVPPVIIHFSRIFQNPSSYWGTPISGRPWAFQDTALLLLTRLLPFLHLHLRPAKDFTKNGAIK